MGSLPLGVGRLDRLLGGGAPPGSVVLLAEESGAGAREFLYTSAAMNALSHADPELFSLHYGDLKPEVSVPPEVHYLSLTEGSSSLRRELAYTMTDEIVDAAAEEIRFRDFSPEYFQLSPLPREWYLGHATTIDEMSQREHREGVLGTMGEYLSEHAPGNLVAIDSLTDLTTATSDEMERGWDDVIMLVRGLKKAAFHWNGLILLLVNEDAITDRQFGALMDAASGTFRFSWETGGSQRTRTMVVREFRGVLSRLEEEDIVQFEIEIHEGGLDISDVRKIR